MSKKRIYPCNKSNDAQKERLTDPKSVTIRLCQLSNALGCDNPKPEYLLQAFESKPKSSSAYEIFHFRNRFLNSTCVKDVNMQSIQQERYKIFLHLYRRLQILESDERKRQQYLTLCYKLFDVDKPDMIAMQNNMNHRVQYIDRLTALTKTVSYYFTNDLDKSDSKTKQVICIKIMRYAYRLSLGYQNCYVKGLSWQLEFSLITKLQDSGNENLYFGTLLKEEVSLPWSCNEDDLFIFHGTIPQQYEEYLESYSKLMLCETKDSKVDCRGSPSTENIWESRHMILFLNDIIEQICREYEIEEIVIGDSQLVAHQGLQTESPRVQSVDQVVQTSEKFMWEYWLEELFDNGGKRVDTWDVDSLSPSTSSLLSLNSVVAIPKLKKEQKLEKEQELELEAEREPVVKEPKTEMEQVFGINLKTKFTALQEKARLVPELELELERGLEPKLKLESKMQLESVLKPVLESKLEPQLVRQLEPQLKPELEPVLGPEVEPALKSESVLVEQFQLPSSLLLARCEHQRHIIAAPIAIIQSLKCNPAYQPLPHEVNPSDFYEQLAQFIETMSLHDIINVNNIRERLAAVIRWNIGSLGQSPEDCIRELSKFQLGQLLTRQELDSYQVMRWYHRDRGDNNAMTPQERRRDALHAMMGYECQQLIPSSQRLHLVLRSPHYQESISESYLLLALSQVGYYYRRLQIQRNKLIDMGEQGKALLPNIISELFTLHLFYEKQQKTKEGASLFHLYANSRHYQLRFQWLLQLCKALTSGGNQLLWTLHWQLGSSGPACDEMLQEWILRATKPLLVQLAKWLTTGELSQSKQDFFIEERAGIEHFWVAKFRLIVQRLPPFLSRQLAQQVLCIGRSHRYAQQFLGIHLSCGLRAEHVQWKLCAACDEFYRERNEQLLEQLIMGLEQETSSELLNHLQMLRPIPLELLTKLHQYLLLSQTDFARDLIELLLPLLEQPVCCYNAQKLNNIMEQLLGQHNSQLYVDQRDNLQATHCWSRFLLRWRQPLHWSALLDHRQPQYAACFESLWQLHYVYYVLNERVQRQQSHFTERISLNNLGDAQEVKLRIERFIGKLRIFIRTLRNYMLHDVLGGAFESLYMACKRVRTVDELLHMHSEYLHEIECGIFQTRQARKSRFYLERLYKIVLQLDGAQQRFLALCQLVVKYLCGAQGQGATTKRLQEFRWSCQTTCDALDDLDKQFQSDLVNFLLSLYRMGGKCWITLAKNLDGDQFYANNFKQLRDVQTFWYQRKKRNQI